MCGCAAIGTVVLCMVKAGVYEAQGGEDQFPAGPRALLSWFRSGRKGLGTCNRFEELNK